MPNLYILLHRHTLRNRQTDTRTYRHTHARTRGCRRRQFRIALDNDWHPYVKTSHASSVIETRSELLGYNNQSIDKLPPGTHRGCTSPAPDVSSRNLNNQLTNTGSACFSTGVCLNLGIRTVYMFGRQFQRFQIRTLSLLNSYAREIAPTINAAKRI